MVTSGRLNKYRSGSLKGWKKLPSINSLLPKSAQFSIKMYKLDNSQRPEDKVSTAIDVGKCAIGLVGYNGASVLHAVLLTKIENNKYVFKNSYGKGNTDPMKMEFIRIPVHLPPWSKRKRVIKNMK